VPVPETAFVVAIQPDFNRPLAGYKTLERSTFSDPQPQKGQTGQFAGLVLSQRLSLYTANAIRPTQIRSSLTAPVSEPVRHAQRIGHGTPG